MKESNSNNFNEAPPPEMAETLMSRVLDGDADDGARSHLAWLLAQSPELRKRWREQVSTHALMRACADTLPKIVFPQKPARTFWILRPYWAAAAALVLLGAVAFAISSQTESRSIQVIEAVGTDRFAVGQTENLRSIQLDSGALRLKLSDGTQLAVTAPVSLRFTHDNTLVLDQGRLILENRGSKNFSVKTPEACVETAQASVGVGRIGSKTDVAVFEGAAQVIPDKAHAFELTGNEAVRLSANNGPERIACILRDINDVEWSWSSSLNADTVISEVKDNVKNSDNFYRIAIGGMREGVPTDYRAKTYWAARNGAEIPHWLENSDLLDMLPTSASHGDYALRMSISQPALVCVIFPDSVARPDWLLKGFVRSDVQLTTQDNKGRASETFSVWRRVVDEPGVVELGPVPASKNGFGYAVATKALSNPALAHNAPVKSASKLLN